MFEIELLTFNVVYPGLMCLHTHARGHHLEDRYVKWFDTTNPASLAPFGYAGRRFAREWHDDVQHDVALSTRALLPEGEWRKIGRWAFLYWSVRYAYFTSPHMPTRVADLMKELQSMPEFNFGEQSGSFEDGDFVFQPSVLGALVMEGLNDVSRYWDHLHRVTGVSHFPSTLPIGLWAGRLVKATDLYRLQVKSLAELETIEK